MPIFCVCSFLLLLQKMAFVHFLKYVCTSFFVFTDDPLCENLLAMLKRDLLKSLITLEFYSYGLWRENSKFLVNLQGEKFVDQFFKEIFLARKPRIQNFSWNCDVNNCLNNSIFFWFWTKIEFLNCSRSYDVKICLRIVQFYSKIV